MAACAVGGQVVLSGETLMLPRRVSSDVAPQAPGQAASHAACSSGSRYAWQAAP